MSGISFRMSGAAIQRLGLGIILFAGLQSIAYSIQVGQASGSTFAISLIGVLIMLVGAVIGHSSTAE